MCQYLNKLRRMNYFSGVSVEIFSLALMFGLRRRPASSAKVSTDYVFLWPACALSAYG